MFISSVQISNFMAFRETEAIEFKPGINLIFGKNNVGKTALLKVLTLSFPNQCHKSPITVPSPGEYLTSGISSAVLSFSIDEERIKEHITISDGTIQIPAPAGKVPGEKAIELFLRALAKNKPSQISYKIIGGELEIGFNVFGAYKPDVEHPDRYRQYLYNMKEDGEYSLRGSSYIAAGQTAERRLFQEIKQEIYCFDPERPRLGRCTFGHSHVLKTDASNLAEVLDVLSENPDRYKEFNDVITSVLPVVKWVSVRNMPNNFLEVYIWMVPKESKRPDLAIPVRSCGTGVGQVLAMLYVVFTANTPRTITIDGPESFLHPSAVRELIRVFRDFPLHQYIIATHSPLVISAADPATTTKILHDGNEAHLIQVDVKEQEVLRGLLDEVGVRLSDVFGADRILWVEGETEERCFPLILESFAEDHHMMRGTCVLPVKHTGDFRQKKKARARLVFSIYTQLSTAQVLIPPALGFVFDQEGLGEADMEELQGESPRPVRFLPRRLFENYLLWPDAIAAILNTEDTGAEKQVTKEDICRWIEEKKQAGTYLPSGTGGVSDWQEWRKIVHGADLLYDLFYDLSNKRVEYRKTRHSFLLTKWLLKNRIETLEEIGIFLRNFVLKCQCA